MPMNKASSSRRIKSFIAHSHFTRIADGVSLRWSGFSIFHLAKWIIAMIDQNNHASHVDGRRRQIVLSFSRLVKSLSCFPALALSNSIGHSLAPSRSHSTGR